MILRHRKKTGYIIEKGFMGREKKVEKEYLYKKHIGVAPLADHIIGKSWGTDIPTHTHRRGDIWYANVVEKHYDAAGYDALYAVGKEILRKITKSRDSEGILLHLLHSFGKENGTSYVKKINPNDPNLTDHDPHVIVHHKKYEEFYSQHKGEFARRAADTVERLLGRKLTSEERRKVERAFELAVEYGKIFHDIYKNAGEDAYDLTSAAAYAYQEEGFKSVEYAEKTLGVDFLEKVGDIILELNKLFPGFSKPEEVYGDRWYEFLKKKGIDPSELNPEKKKSKTTASSRSLTFAARELLGLLSGLRLAGYSEGALENLRLELEKRIDGLIENPGENLELIGLYTAVLKLAEKGEIEKAEEFLRGL